MAPSTPSTKRPAGGLGLSETTDSVTAPLDNTVNDTLNNVAPGLGDQVTDTVDGILGG